jgi:hypothetical protein
MNNLHKNKLLTWLVLVLVVINIGSMIFIWMGKPKHQNPPHGSPKEFLSRELKFDEKQQVQYDKLVDEHRNQANDTRKKIKEEKEKMYGLLKNASLTDSLKKSAVERVAEATKELDLITLNHFEKVRNICTPEQKTKLDQIMMQMLGMMSAQQPMRHLPPPNDSLHHKIGDHPPAQFEHEKPSPKTEGHQIEAERDFHDGPPPPRNHDGPPPGDHRGPPPPRDHHGPPPGEHRGPPPTGEHRGPPPPPRDHKLPPPPDHK